MTWRQLVFAGIAAPSLLACPALAETVLGDDTRAALTLTLSQNNGALVHDRRHAVLEAGEQILVIEPVPRQGRLEAGGLKGPDLAVRSQQLDVDGIDAATLLSAHRGHEVTVIWRGANGSEREERATVLATDGQPVFRIGGKVISGQPERVVFDTLPPGLRAVPAYRAEVSAEHPGKREVELSYVSGGLSWHPAYVVEVEDGGKAMLSSWAELSNTSGGDFPNARIRLLAGETNRAPGPEPRFKAMMANEAQPQREALDPYHLYTLPGPLSLRDGESTQVPLLPPLRLNVERRLELPPVPAAAWAGRFHGDLAVHPDAVLALHNTAGQPLPAGPARLFLRSKDGGLAFAGEDTLPMVPAGAPFRLSLGKVFDVTAQRVQTDVQKVSSDITETAWEVRLDNAGDNPVKVLVNEAFAGEWLVLEESQRHDKSDASQAGWTVQVPARGETVLRYRIRIKL